MRLKIAIEGRCATMIRRSEAILLWRKHGGGVVSARAGRGAQLAKEAVDADFLGEEATDGIVVSLLLSGGDGGADFAEAAFEVALVEVKEGGFDLLGEGLGCGVKGGFHGVFRLGRRFIPEDAGEEGSAPVVGCGVEGV